MSGPHEACGAYVVLAGDPEYGRRGFGADELGQLHLVRLPHLMLGLRRGKKMS